ncbi:MAG: hypothetical protein BGP06_09635 [Rhizobiales bacterium 65-9]|nr:FAD-dependent oxidoreductase [Hyphomicrobiales bacterium]OJY34605.1 MAG: hypothetical protein BGP06_09635 [Rhizobiales bacterium 65-9]
MLDAVVIGGGAAGIAAARTLDAAGLSVAIVEARDRLGGRAHTILLDGAQVDEGAHWMHMAEVNPLVGLARRAGFTSRRAPEDRPLYDNGRLTTGARRRAMDRGWPKLDQAVARVARSGVDETLAASLPALGEWTETFAFGLGLYSGADIRELSAIDYARTADGTNRFLKDGYGALLARLARPLTVHLGRPATRLRSGEDRVVVETAAGDVEARWAIVTAPTGVLKGGAIRFDPELPADLVDAVAGFSPAAYEHAILRWPESPFHRNGADQLTLFRGDQATAAAMLACIGGGDLHYFELGGPHAKIWRNGDEAWKRAHVREVLSLHFGKESDAAEILHVTGWWSDPWSRGSWSVCAPGRYVARDALRHYSGGRLRFASEATSPDQWGTVGGAWREGARAARKIIAALRS